MTDIFTILGFGTSAPTDEVYKGEKDTSYVSKCSGSEHCSNCKHFVATENGCASKNMKALSKRPRLPNGDVAVVPAGYCKFYAKK